MLDFPNIKTKCNDLKEKKRHCITVECIEVMLHSHIAVFMHYSFMVYLILEARATCTSKNSVMTMMCKWPYEQVKPALNKSPRTDFNLKTYGDIPGRSYMFYFSCIVVNNFKYFLANH